MKKYIYGGVAVIALLILSLLSLKVFENNDAHTYHVWQGLGGSIRVIDEPGLYLQNFGKSYPYDRTIQIEFKAHNDSDGDQSIRTTFNDGGRAQIGTVLNIALPTNPEKRLLLHRTFGGNIKNLELAVYAHLTNAVKNSGPLMTGTENQTGRKAEFNQIIEDQLRNGLYEMRRQERVLEGQLDADGKPIKVIATQIITDEKGKPKIVHESPLTQYGLTVNQFSIIETEYDELTQKQFTVKQQAFLAGESSKAQRDQEIQQKLFIEAKGQREASEAEASANLEKVKAEMAGKQRVAVAEQAKLEAKTLADQKLEVATIEKQEAETQAQKLAEVARIAAENDLKIAEIELQIAGKDAEAKLKLAEATAKEIEIAGKVKENDKVLAEIAATRDVNVATALSKIAVPSTVIGGGTGDGKGLSLTDTMINYQLLRSSGLLNTSALPQAAPATKPAAN